MKEVLDKTTESLENIVYNQILKIKETHCSILISLPSERHAIYIKDFYPFNIVLVLIYHHNGEPIRLSSDEILEREGVRYNDTNKQIKRVAKDIVRAYENIDMFENAWAKQFAKKDTCEHLI